MAQNQIITQYDDNGFPSQATKAVPLTFAGGIIKGGPGRLVKVVVTTVFVGSGGQLAFYDNAKGDNSGTPLLTIPAAAAATAGVMFSLDLPAFAGISAVNTGGTLTGGAVTVAYS